MRFKTCLVPISALPAAEIMTIVKRARRRSPAPTIVIAQHTVGYRTAALGPLSVEDSRPSLLLTTREHPCWTVRSVWSFGSARGGLEHCRAVSQIGLSPLAPGRLHRFV